MRENRPGRHRLSAGEPETWEGWEDSAVPPDKVGAYLREFRALLDKYGYHGALYGHFGQGCVHTRIDFDLRTAPGIAELPALHGGSGRSGVSAYGGSLSGEHGDGQSRGELLPRMFGPELVQAFARVQGASGIPHGNMNPGKLDRRPCRPHDESASAAPATTPRSAKTHFAYPDDDGSFAHATLRCVGVGECRRKTGRHHVPELPGHARGETLARAAARTCSSR